MPDDVIDITPPASFNPEAEHNKRIASGDREYIENYFKNSAKKGHVFSVTLVCDDPFLSQQLWQSVQPDSKILVAGCKVATIFGGDLGAAHVVIKQQLQQLLKMMGG